MKIKYKVVTTIMVVFFLGVSLFAWFKPLDEFSESERRKLETFPKVSFENIISGKFMKDFESYTLDQFPLRDELRTLKALTAFNIFNQKDNNKIYIENGFASKIEYPINENSIKRASDRFLYIYNKYFKDKNIKPYFSIIPDKNYFLAKENGYLSIDYDKFFLENIKKNDFMTYIDIRDLLEIEDYYKTDTHWRQEKIIDVANRISENMGVSLKNQYEEQTLDKDFYGVYYGQSALPLKPEKIKYLKNDVLENCKVFDYQNNKEISIYDMEKAHGKDPYEMFLSGPISLLSIENEKATTDKELVIFRDSFGSSIAPLLVEGYKKITLVDIRYIHPDLLSKYIEFENQDVLFLYSTMVLNNSETIK